MSVAERISTIRARAAPLASPTGIIVPPSAATGSVVARPAASRAQPSGIASPRCFAPMILPRATLLRDISITSGCFPSLGQPKASGFVPKDAFDPFHGAIAAGVLEKINDMSPASAIRSAYSPTTPQWCDRVTPNTDTPLPRARGMAFSSPARMAGKANPFPASTSTAAGAA